VRTAADSVRTAAPSAKTSIASMGGRHRTARTALSSIHSVAQRCSRRGTPAIAEVIGARGAPDRDRAPPARSRPATPDGCGDKGRSRGGLGLRPDLVEMGCFLGYCRCYAVAEQSRLAKTCQERWPFCRSPNVSYRGSQVRVLPGTPALFTRFRRRVPVCRPIGALTATATAAPPPARATVGRRWSRLLRCANPNVPARCDAAVI
jgi:hypothetical protein